MIYIMKPKPSFWIIAEMCLNARLTGRFAPMVSKVERARI